VTSTSNSTLTPDFISELEKNNPDDKGFHVNKNIKVPYSFMEIFERELARLEETRILHTNNNNNNSDTKKRIIMIYNSQPAIKRRDILREILENYTSGDSIILSQ
jgi:hypothetical protein